jgi:hypothetical protein
LTALLRNDVAHESIRRRVEAAGIEDGAGVWPKAIVH